MKMAYMNFKVANKCCFKGNRHAQNVPKYELHNCKCKITQHMVHKTFAMRTKGCSQTYKVVT